jgi:tripartite-type tricarboxylate transporter receptor subunit TctC
LNSGSEQGILADFLEAGMYTFRFGPQLRTKLRGPHAIRFWPQAVEFSWLQVAASLCALALFGSGAVQAQTYPSRPVRMIVPLAPGGSMDTIARALGHKLTEATGENFVVDNRPGAGSAIGLETAANSPKDGHTVVVMSATTLVYPIMYKARFDVLRDFEPVSQITAQGYLLAVNPSKVPVQSVPELVAYLKANPGKLNFASSGIGSLIHLSGELFMVATGTRMTHIPYKGMGAAYTDLVGGNVELSFPTIVSSQAHVKAGRLRALAVTLPKRAPAVPDLPTMAEAGVKGVVVTNWYGGNAEAGRRQAQRRDREDHA